MKIFFFCFLFISLPAKAVIENFQLMAGGGLNTSAYAVNNGVQVGGGLNIKTDLIYFLSKNFGLEWSSQVKFNRINGILIWDTLMTVGARLRFDNSPYYVRGFFGRSPTVFYLDGAPEVTRDTNSSRLQYDGNVFGLGVGKSYTTEKGRIWFIELDLSYQNLDKEKGIRNDGEVPVEIFNQRAANPIQIYSIYATIGVRVF